MLSFSFAGVTLSCVLTAQTPLHDLSFPSVYGNFSLVKRPGLSMREVLTMNKNLSCI